MGRKCNNVLNSENQTYNLAKTYNPVPKRDKTVNKIIIIRGQSRFVTGAIRLSGFKSKKDSLSRDRKRGGDKKTGSKRGRKRGTLRRKRERGVRDIERESEKERQRGGGEETKREI